MAEPRLPGSDRLLLAAATLLGLAVAASLTLAAWTTGLVLYADGALFSFIVGTGDAWGLIWHVMPARIAVYLLTVLPAETARDWGLPAPAAMRLYQALFSGVAFLGLAACIAVLPPGRRWALLFPVLSILALAVSALGYPSETLLTLAGFWPALFGYRHADGRVGRGILTLLATAVFLFSHPGMVLALPLLPLAALLRWRDCRERGVRRELLALGAAGSVLVCLWVWRVGVELGDPGIIQSGQRMWSLQGLHDVVALQPAIVIVLLDILLWAVLAWRREPGAFRAAILGPPAIALAFAVLHRETVTAESHYYIRTALIFALPGLGALALASGRAPPRGMPTLAMMAAIAATQVLHNLSFLDAWRDYRDSVAASVAAGPARIVPLGEVMAGRARPNSGAIAWSWGQPYLSLTLPALPHYTAIVADPAPDSHSPFHCSQMGAIVRHADWVPPATLALLKDYVCARRPE